MAFTRIAKGTATAKTAGTTLSTSAFTTTAGGLLHGGVSFLSTVTAGSFTTGYIYTIVTAGTTNFTLIGAVDSNPGTIFTATGAGTGTGTASEHPTLAFGSRTMIEVPLSSIIELNSGIQTINYRAVIGGSNSRTPTFTWSNNANARACYFTEVAGAGAKDVGSTKADTSTTAPATGSIVTTTSAETFHLASFGANGPSTDTAATANLGHTIGQRAGTSGGAAASNVTIQETFESLSATGDCRATLTATTARRWANSIVAYAGQSEYRASIGSNDLEAVREIFDGKITPIDHEFMSIYYNGDANRWEVYNRAAAVTGDTLIAYYEVDGAGWVEV